MTSPLAKMPGGLVRFKLDLTWIRCVGIYGVTKYSGSLQEQGMMRLLLAEIIVQHFVWNTDNWDSQEKHRNMTLFPTFRRIRYAGFLCLCVYITFKDPIAGQDNLYTYRQQRNPRLPSFWSSVGAAIRAIPLPCMHLGTLAIQNKFELTTIELKSF